MKYRCDVFQVKAGCILDDYDLEDNIVLTEDMYVSNVVGFIKDGERFSLYWVNSDRKVCAAYGYLSDITQYKDLV